MKNVNMINSVIKNIFLDSWKIYKDNYVIIMQMMLLFFCFFGIGMYIFLQFIYFDGSIIYSKDPQNPSFIIFPLFFILFIMGLYLSGIKISLLLNKNKKSNVMMLFSCFNFIFVYLIGQIIVSIPLLVIQSLLNIIIYFFVRLIVSFFFAFYPFIIIDQEINNPLIGLKKSFIMTTNNLNITAPLYFILLIANIILGGFIMILLIANIILGGFTMFLGFIILLPLLSILLSISIFCYTRLYLLILKKQGI